MKTPHLLLFSLLSLASASVMSSCEKTSTAPTAFRDGLYPAAPHSLVAFVDSGMIKLEWTFADSIRAKQFNIYRQDSAEEEQRRIGTSTQTHFNDRQGFSANREYGYSVSAVSDKGYEGKRSESYYIIFGGGPSGVFLLTPVALDTFPSAFQLSWTLSPDTSDFAAYQIYRSQTPEVDFDSTPIATITRRLTLSYVDRGLQADADYSYRLYVFNRAGRYTASNVVMVHTPSEVPPVPVTLAQPAPLDSAALRLSWSRNVDVDFASYRVFRSIQSPVDLNALPQAIINDAVTTTYEDRRLTPGVTYYYRVAVFDRAGLYSSSNEVSGSVR